MKAMPASLATNTVSRAGKAAGNVAGQTVNLTTKTVGTMISSGVGIVIQFLFVKVVKLTSCIVYRYGGYRGEYGNPRYGRNRSERCRKNGEICFKKTDGEGATSQVA